MWMTTTRAFADQLVSQGSYQRAVLYYLACHDIYTAIDVFRKQAMYRWETRHCPKITTVQVLIILCSIFCFQSHHNRIKTCSTARKYWQATSSDD